MLALLSRAGMIGLGIWHGDPGNERSDVRRRQALAVGGQRARRRRSSSRAYFRSASLRGATSEAALEHSLEPAAASFPHEA